ncbi:hypothetical protein AMECASPLE_027843, partial [Ameca splendens]
MRTERLLREMSAIRFLETLLVVLLFTNIFTEANPQRKRSISEVQFMHNVQEHKQVGERQDWLQETLKKIILASPKPQHAKPGILKSLPPENVYRPS